MVEATPVAEYCALTRGPLVLSLFLQFLVNGTSFWIRLHFSRDEFMKGISNNLGFVRPKKGRAKICQHSSCWLTQVESETTCIPSHSDNGA